ncbi:sensor histidine kinase [Paenibacillus sp. FSL P4-0338]|uniref:sensor histidine kinase n=1 Tax=unclassified Paenibacillus TaxID=185978 RepID=UPI0003E25005|nr:sensor histidine kinase [Paenibacillus sp. FSL R7-269]ETT50013.1 integral membrane sensor signal transduction histidine kinase [Paenibacillus sp. FSL R7-269]
MTRELILLRYSLLIIPAILSIQVYEFADYDGFTLHFMLLMLLVILGARPSRSLATLTEGMELILTAWLCYEYGPLMVFPALSAVISYTRRQPKNTALTFFCIHLALLNAALLHTAPAVLVFTNLTFLLCAGLNLLLLRAGRVRTDTLFLYDELRKKHFELEEARARLLQFTSHIEVAAQADERVRIARQLHDDIGHRLIRVKMMTEAAIHTLPAAPESGLQMMNQIRDQLSGSMDDMRTALKRINHTPQLEGAHALDRLLEEVGRDTGIATTYTVQGIPYPLYPSLQVVLYTNAREAITNALRHGQASSVWVEVTYTEHEVRMETGNNGKLPEADPLGRLPGSSGMGLTGMSERCAMLGGTLELRLQPQFTVITRLPVYRQPEEAPR